MNQPRRLPQGGRIDRNRPLDFTFDGRPLQGFAGDTLASALLAAGVTVVSRSIKLHRPRGIVGRGAEEPNALLQLEHGVHGLPDQRATDTELYPGLSARPVVGRPCYDSGSAMGALAPFMPAGFYYKTFMAPQGWWERYERIIRPSAGTGLAPTGPDPDIYDRLYTHCDVLVAGGGPAGLQAALTAARAGARVILAHERPVLGGGLLLSRARIDGQPAGTWVQQVLAELAEYPAVRVLARTTVFGAYDHGFFGLLERLGDHLPPEQRQGPRQRYWRVRARRAVVAAGATERPILFGNNDRPGIMTASAVTDYIRQYAVAPGRRAVVFTNNDTGYTAVDALREAGIQVAAVADTRESPGGIAETAGTQNVKVHSGTVVAAAHGRRQVTAVTLASLAGSWRSRLDCDLVAVSGGWNPNVHLHSQRRGPLRFDPVLHSLVPADPLDTLRCAGACNGATDLPAALAEGATAGAWAAAETGHRAPRPVLPAVTGYEPGPGSLQPFWRTPETLNTGPAFVDLQNDVKVSDLALAVREGYRDIEHVKRYSILGYGTDQGRLGNVVGAGVVAELLGHEPGQVGTTTFRPPYTPVCFGAIVAEEQRALFQPARTTPMHDWHTSRGAVFEDVGPWKRPRYYPQGGETMDQAVHRECLATARDVGVLDYSTLGKIDIQGPDAAEFLNRVYTNGWKRLPVGRCRYGLMLDENGMVFDDGVTARLDEQHYLMHTTTGGGDRVLDWLERWLQTEWPRLRVNLTPVTDHWATISLAGPRSRALLAALGTDIDLSANAFPFMAIRQGRLAGVPARVQRVSFSGELTFEVSVSADLGLALWERVMDIGRHYGATPYGTETMHVLRAEKGFIIVGQDTDGSVSPLDLGLRGLVSDRKDFLGKRSLQRPELQRADRPQFVAFLPENPETVVPEGAQLVAAPDGTPPVPLSGWVTSSYYGTRLGRSFGLAMVNGGLGRHGERLYAWDLDAGAIPVTLTTPVLVDPKGERQHV